MARSEAAKKASSKEGNANANFGVATGRSGESAIPYIHIPRYCNSVFLWGKLHLADTVQHFDRWWDLNIKIQAMEMGEARKRASNE